MLSTPFYDPTKSCEENYEKGPFGDFADGKVSDQTGEPTHDFFGSKVYLPFGIPAGPVLNSAFCKAAFEKNFDLVVYKTVRSSAYPCHPFPNVLAVDTGGDLTLEKAQKPLIGTTNYTEPLSITNSFGVPSKDAAEWQADAKKAISFARKGQVLILSFMGTVRPNQTEDELVADFALAAKQSVATGAKVLEVNLSCPNIGNEGLVCYVRSVREKALAAIRKEIGNTPLIVKTGYFADQSDLQAFAKTINEYANGVAAINTIPAAVLNAKGEQALLGKNRLKSGVCGAGITWAGLDMVKRLKEIQQQHNYQYKIIGVGGVMNSLDYRNLILAGADAVMSATGAMWNPQLANEILEQVKSI